MPILKTLARMAFLASMAAIVVYLGYTSGGDVTMYGAAVIGTTLPTYVDLASRMDKNGAIANIIEVMMANNAVMQDLQIQTANDGTGHRTTVRSGIPQAAWRMLNYGVPRVKSRTVQVRDTTGMLAAYMEVDKTLADLSGNVNRFRNTEDGAVREGMTQQMAETLFYGNTDVNPERFLGLAPRYSQLSAPSGASIIDAGGTGSDNTSIWLVSWGELATHGIVPEGVNAGFDHRDLGEVTLLDANGGQFQGYRTYVEWHLGLTVRDWRQNIRIANIDVSNLSSDANYLKALISLMIDAEEALPEQQAGTKVWYGNKTVRSALRKSILAQVSNNLTETTVNGKPFMDYNGAPFRRTDAIINAEARVV
jgi:hypothetical protein